MLRTAHSLFKRYRFEFKSNELWSEIKLVLEHFAPPLTALFVVSLLIGILLCFMFIHSVFKLWLNWFQTFMNLAKQHENNKDAIKLIYSSLLLVSKIFFSLNSQVSKLHLIFNYLWLVNVTLVYLPRKSQSFLRITWMCGCLISTHFWLLKFRCWKLA